MPTSRGISCLLALGVLGLTACSYTDDAQPKSGNYLATQPDSGPAGGEIEDRISPSDTHLPALARLHTTLLAALHSAAADAQKSGVALYVTSGWRSAAFQQRLWDDAVVKYGSASVAAQWVHPPNLSKHVSGQAVDIGPTNADDWLIQHGSDYGLCQTYANEMWHFELATTPGGECPLQLSNPSDVRAEG